MQRGLRLISEMLPKDCAISNPSGGFVCWLPGPQGFDAVAASRRALLANISLAPGPMFSPAASHSPRTLGVKEAEVPTPITSMKKATNAIPNLQPELRDLGPSMTSANLESDERSRIVGKRVPHRAAAAG